MAGVLARDCEGVDRHLPGERESGTLIRPSPPPALGAFPLSFILRNALFYRCLFQMNDL